MRAQEMPRGTPVAKAWPMQTPATTAAGARLRAWQSSRPMQLKAEGHALAMLEQDLQRLSRPPALPIAVQR
jgi:hypothetical protein